MSKSHFNIRRTKYRNNLNTNRSRKNDSGEAFLKELFNEGPMGSLPQLTSNPINTNYFTPNVDSAINFNAVNQLQNEPIFSPLNFPTPVATTAPHPPPEFLTPSNLKREPNAPKFLSEKVFRKRTELCPEPHASNKEPSKASVASCMANWKVSAKEKILEIANLLKLNPQLIPVIEKLSDLVAQLPKGASTDQILSDVEFPGSLRGGRPDSLQNTPDLFTRSRLGESGTSPRNLFTQALTKVSNSRAPNLKSGRTDHGADNLLYQFATEDLPDELEGDHDFINNDYDPEIDNEAPVVTNRELKELFEDSESSTNEESEKKKFRIKTEEHQTEPPLFSTEVLSRIRSQQQQNLQLVLQAYAIECRFRGAESEKALYWKACTSTSLEDPTFDPEDTRSFISFFTVPGADYMDAMLEAFTNPPEAIGCASGAPTKSKTPVMSMKKRDWAVYFPEKDFIAPNSPKNVVDKARCISVLIDEIFQPIFLKRLKPFFATIKKRDRPIFTPAEDNLFTIGLYKFGDDWASIRSHLLPPRSSRQLENRFNNLKSRRAQYTPIQQYYLRQIKPLTLKEEELLTQGVRYYGRKFRVISQRMIPNRPSFVLKKAWREMELRKIALNRPVFLDSYH
ncbi:hypothetical protein L0F63_000423 [Massospora cicadina]|nr:hypothetical protein L0F63_000423 [Massospora cicadina]